MLYSTVRIIQAIHKSEAAQVRPPLDVIEAAETALSCVTGQLRYPQMFVIATARPAVETLLAWAESQP